ncbi:uncharacterized protein LOC130902107 [Diorhabda carinulata]|uniref:uncharacterized protein LOC130902107 n=1 Tax=Diorhabda carinulata TaxID=1163345 RepID=UPI0025A2003F|nr:uncharacterized protein LOC130902107 [Diorhabda carinulata]XP_057669923.1 uncharacterized protein LOC130902107 [Diorhabda carinulata]
MVRISITQIYPIILVLIPLVSTQTTIATNQVTENIIVSTLPEETFEYIIKLVFGLENEKVPSYLVNWIYENSNDVTPNDIISLYSINNWNLSTTTRVLEELGYNPHHFFSVDGLENILMELKLDFKNFYDTIFFRKLGVSGIQLRNFLKNLDINTNDFSNAMTYGEGDPLEIFKKGNFSEENFQNGLQDMDKSKEELFEACKEEILLSVSTKTTNEIITVLNKYGFNKEKALKLWNFTNINIEDVNNIVVFSDLLDEFKFNLDNITYLGIFINKSIAINQIVLENIKNNMRLCKLFAQKLSDYNATVEIMNMPKSYNQQIVTLPVVNRDNFTTNPAEISATITDLHNCTFITVENDAPIYQKVQNIVINDLNLQVNLDLLNISKLVLGSPLICDNKVYGLAKNVEDGNVVFDTFVVEPSSGSSSTISILLFLICGAIYAVA